MSRLDQLQQFLTEDPHDPFNIYALALEYRKLDTKKACQLFDQLLEEHQDYIPTYYHAGKLFQEIGEREKSSRIFETGIQLARTKNDFKALRELQAALNESLFDS